MLCQALPGKAAETAAYNRWCDAQKELWRNQLWRTPAGHPQSARINSGATGRSGRHHAASDFLLRNRGRLPAVARVIDLAKALRVTTDELLGVKAAKVERINDDSEARRMWKRFQMVAGLPERDQKAVIRLIHSLAGSSAARP